MRAHRSSLQVCKDRHAIRSAPPGLAVVCGSIAEDADPGVEHGCASPRSRSGRAMSRCCTTRRCNARQHDFLRDARQADAAAHRLARSACRHAAATPGGAPLRIRYTRAATRLLRALLLAHAQPRFAAVPVSAGAFIAVYALAPGHGRRSASTGYAVFPPCATERDPHPHVPPAARPGRAALHQRFRMRASQQRRSRWTASPACCQAPSWPPRRSRLRRRS